MQGSRESKPVTSSQPPFHHCRGMGHQSFVYLYSNHKPMAVWPFAQTIAVPWGVLCHVLLYEPRRVSRHVLLYES